MSRKTKTTATKEEARPALVPKLRFPEFRNTDAWEATTIGGLGRFYYGKSAPKWSLSEDAPTPCVRYGELYTKFGPVISETYSRTNTDPRTLRFSKGGEILIPRVGEKPEDFGKCCAYLPLKDIAIGEMISVLETEQNPLFYTYYFRHLHRQFAKVVEGQNVKNLYFAELQPLPIHRPSKPEQQKIAECLSSVDELMAAQARKVDALKTHKKGLMQQLFPREGETQPRLRFPEFQNAGEWVVRTIGEMFSLINGCAFKPEDWKPSGTPIIRIQNLNDPSAEFNYSQEPVPERNRVEPGDLLFAWSGTLGSSFGARIWNGPSGVLNQHIFKVLMDEQQIRLQFALLVLARVEEDIARRTHGFKASFVHVKKSDLVQVELLLPSVPEQERIASCLSSLDALITAETQKLEALKTHKKGLMQQLFPQTHILRL